MSINRKLGILVTCGVPVIVGGGIIFAIFDSYSALAVYEIVLMFIFGGFVSN